MFSDDSDDEYMLKKCLDVKLSSNFDPHKIPESGEEYLQLVMHERKKCKTWVSADYDQNRFNDCQTFNVELIEGCAKAPSCVTPSAEWQARKLEDFAKLRKFLELRIGEPSDCTIPNWDYWMSRVRTKPPTFSDATTWSQQSKCSILCTAADVMREIPDGESLPHVTGTWIYAVLATLDYPLSPNICHYLRDLARQCAKVRSKITRVNDTSLFMQLNLIICIIGKYFKQFDLADS